MTSEHDIQAGIVAWARLRVSVEPRLGLLYAIPNGGKRDAVTAAWLRDEGVTAGVPDLCLACPGRAGHALYIEVKTARGRLSEEQRAWHKRLREAGNGVVVVRSIAEGVCVICDHIERDDLQRELQ